MKVALVLSSLVTLLNIFRSIQAWDEDPRCLHRDSWDRRELRATGYNVQTETNTRSSVTRLQNTHTYDSYNANNNDLTNSFLRGTGRVSRNQQESDAYSFQLKLFWRLGWCWQDEWDEREYCMSCEGDNCNEGDQIIVQPCDDNQTQRFHWEPVPDTGGGRLRPTTEPHLCWQQDMWNQTNPYHYRLMPCDMAKRANSTQIIVGWQPADRFELFPYQETERCFSQQHDPRPYEVIYANDCALARADKTNYWVVHNPYGYPPADYTQRPSSWCPKPYDLKLSTDEFVWSGQDPFYDPEHNLTLEQESNGNLVVRQGNVTLWETHVSGEEGDWYTVLQSDGNMITRKGSPPRDGDPVWKSNRVQEFFLGLDCDGTTIAVYKGSPDSPLESVWSTGYTSPISEWCQPISLNLLSNQAVENGQTLTNTEANLSLEQWSNGNLVVRRNSTLLWESSATSDEYGAHFTVLTGNGKLKTYKGTTPNPSEIVWQNSDESITHMLFLGLDCDGETVAVYEGSPNDPGDSFGVFFPVPAPVSLVADEWD